MEIMLLSTICVCISDQVNVSSHLDQQENVSEFRIFKLTLLTLLTPPDLAIFHNLKS